MYNYFENRLNSFMNVNHFEAIYAIKTYLPTWTSLQPEEILFERLRSLSNGVWKVSALSSDIEPSSVILRQINPNTSSVEREKEELIIRSLSQRGIGPMVYGGHEKLRVEMCYESRNLLRSDFHHTSVKKQLAKSLAAFHKVQLAGLNTTPVLERMLDEKSLIQKVIEKAQLDIYTPEEKKALDVLLTLTDHEEIEFLKQILPKDQDSIVFSHNDLHCGNILLLEGSNKMVIIDYETTDYNIRGFDIASMFGHDMFEQDISKYPYYNFNESKFPSYEVLFQFVKHYLFFVKFEPSSAEADLIQEDEALLMKYVEENYDISKFVEEIDKIIEEVKICCLFWHYYWLMWAILMHKTVNNNFEYLLCAQARYRSYQSLKSKLFSCKNVVSDDNLSDSPLQE